MRSTDELAWYRATTLTERVARGCAPELGATAEDDRARYRFEGWRSQAPFGQASYFEQRLAIDGLTEGELRGLLAETTAALRERLAEPPDWLSDLTAALSSSCVGQFTNLLPERLKKKPTVGFLDVAAALVEHALHRLDSALAPLANASSDLPFDPSNIKRILLADLPDVLLPMLSRALALQLNIARLQGELAGTTPEERFGSFIEHLRDRDRVLQFLQDYPVLARLLIEQLDRWVTVSVELIDRLCRDRDLLNAAFGAGGNLGILTAVAAGLSDTHRGGRSVAILRFSSGIRIVYKPKSLAVDAHFQELLRWLNARGLEPSVRTLAVLDRGSYGWVEFVTQRDCGSEMEVRRFYERQGAYVAVLYMLEATDFHADNVIACGEHPFLIDLEALFHPRRSPEEAADLDSADRLARDTISHSVLSSGLLPDRVWSDSESEGVDLSGLGTIDGQVNPHGHPDWEEAGADTMHLVSRRHPVGARNNRPTVNGVPASVLDYREEILRGFASTYRLLMTHRDDLLSPDGPLQRFAGDEVCVFLRSARTYRRLLRESYHPDVLRDALDRDRLFDLLWIEVEDEPDLVRVIATERDDLLRGDIPLFTARPMSCDLWSSASDPIPDFFPESSMSVVQRRVRELWEQDLAQQAWFIEASLASLPTSAAHWPTCSARQIGSRAGRDQLEAGARAVGDRLEALALREREKDEASWIGLTGKRDRVWSIAPCGLDLHGGLPGIATFLAYLGLITGQERYRTLSTAAVTAMQRRIEKRPSSVKGIGGFDGWGGVIYALTHIGLLSDRPDLIAEAESFADKLPALIEQDEVLDVFGGAAGCIGALRSLYHCAPSERVAAAAIQCGDHLLASAQHMEQGIAWVPRVGGLGLQAGFAHGAAGVAWSLLELYAWTGLERFRAAALAAMACERSNAAQNWPDQREHDGAEGVSLPAWGGATTAWCHGGGGIALARLCSLAHVDDPAARREIEVAIGTTLRQGFGHNHSLCHGDLGNAEILLQAGRALQRDEWKARAQEVVATALDSIGTHGWRCGVPFGVETPGLMTGLAGIGYALLRLAEPERVPSILVLEPPRLSPRRAHAQ